MGFFVIGDIDTNHIIQTIKNNFDPFNNSKELEFPNYKIPDYPDNQFFVYQDDEQESISFSIFEKNDFKKINSFKNYREAVISYLTEVIFQRRVNEIKEKNEQSFLDAYISGFNASDLDEFRIAAVVLKEDESAKNANVETKIADKITLIHKMMEKT